MEAKLNTTNTVSPNDNYPTERDLLYVIIDRTEGTIIAQTR